MKSVTFGRIRLSVMVTAIAAGTLLAAPMANAARPDESVAPKMSSTTKIDAIALVEGATCVLLLDHRIRCWRDYGLMQTSAPTSPPPAGAFTSIGADLFSLCGIRPDASVACWAYGEDAVDPPASTFSAVSGQCGIKTDQTLLCWYFDGEDTIVSVPLEGTFSAISSPCAIRTDGTLACWGDEYSDLIPTPTGSFKAVEARSDVACAIRTDETVACWGDPYEGQTAAPTGTFSAVGVGFFTSCGIRTDGTLTCWGDHRPKPWQPIVGTFTALTMDDGGCAIRADQTFACWGSVPWPPRPTAVIESMPAWQMSSRGVVRWSAIPALATVKAFDLRTRSTPWDGIHGAWRSWRSNTDATHGRFRLQPGVTRCFSERAHDTAGQTSVWTDKQAGRAHRACITLPLDERSLARSTGWTALAGDQYYRSGALLATRRGSTLTLTGSPDQKVALVVTTCPRCGVVRLFSGKYPIKKVDLSSDARHDQVLIPVASRSDLYGTGTFTIKVVSDGKKVLIDGLAVFNP